jgi:hypothetical protein
MCVGSSTAPCDTRGAAAVAVGTAGGTPKPVTIGITSVFARDRSPSGGTFGASAAPSIEMGAVVADDASLATFEESLATDDESLVAPAAFDESLVAEPVVAPAFPAAFDASPVVDEPSVVVDFEESVIVAAFEESPVVAEPVVAPAFPAAFEASPPETFLVPSASAGGFFDSSFVTGPAASSSISAPVFILRAYATGLGRSIFEIFELAGGFRLMAFIGASVRACGQV